MLLLFDNIKAAKICMILWNMWRQRNGKLWRNDFLSATQMVHIGLEYLSDWSNARMVSHGHGSSTCVNQFLVHLCKPAVNFLKCNTDAYIPRAEENCNFKKSGGPLIIHQSTKSL